MTAEYFAKVPSEARDRIAKDCADDGAGAYALYMAGELKFLGQRAEQIKRAYALANVQPRRLKPSKCGVPSISGSFATYGVDNPVNDVHGARAAGLLGILLDRAPDHKNEGPDILQNLSGLASRITGNTGFLGGLTGAGIPICTSVNPHV